MALIQNSDLAVIAPEKLRDYLYPLNRGKARFFRALGYTQDNWPQLASDLRNQHLTRDATEGRSSVSGRTYLIIDALRGPIGLANS
jgi:hypothetical protein